MSGPERFSGAAARGSDMVIITVRREGEGFCLCEDASGRLVMLDRGQGEMRAFAADLSVFVEKSGIERVVLRGAPAKGDFRAHPRVYMMEAALQLQPGVDVSMVTGATLDRWQRHSGHLAPPVHPSVTVIRQIELNELATRAACLSAMGWPHPSWCDPVK